MNRRKFLKTATIGGLASIINNCEPDNVEVANYPKKTFEIGIEEIYWTGPHSHGYPFLYRGMVDSNKFKLSHSRDTFDYPLTSKVVNVKGNNQKIHFLVREVTPEHITLQFTGYTKIE